MNNHHGVLANYQAEFAIFLRAKKYSDFSVKSSVSDLSHYFDWVVIKASNSKIKLSENNELFAYFSFGAIEQYFDFCQTIDSTSTFKRRITTIQNFIKFAVTKKWLSSKILSEAEKLAKKYALCKNENQKHVAEFTKFLQEKGVAKNTLRSYVADINEYLVIN